MKNKINIIAKILLAQAIVNFIMCLILTYRNDEKWFSCYVLSMILLGFYGVIKAIQSLKDK